MCRSWIDSGFDGTLKQRLVHQVLCNLCHLHYLGMVTVLGTSEREIATTWEHFRFAPDGDYGTSQGAVLHVFWVSFFFIHGFFFITLV
jgi:chromosome condensin MukBEF MukE localization factor